ncbi:winged helix-turn-helix transcriptional regulator [Microbispora corallina]|uniref:winged helix-turn-helix transcriptional regulator n=1 Tax=Microbispora corallina TaxID=83302 RepID=UPI001EF384FC|nr:winged helix-turn-helix transcriptional regulator [Microbispora corallina]
MRSYGEACATAHALDVIGERWALLVVRDLLLGPKRFSDLERGMPGINARILAQRLRELEDAGVVRRRRLGPPVSGMVYELTEWGADLETVIAHLGRWGRRSPRLDLDAEIGPDAAVLALRQRFDPGGVRDLTATYAVRFEYDQFVIQVAGGDLRVTRESPSAPDAVLTTDPRTFAELVTGRLTVPEAVARGRLAVTGDRAAVERLLAAVPVAR